MSEEKTRALNYAREHQGQFLDELKTLLTIPSVSTDPDRTAELSRAAGWVATRLRDLGVESVRLFPPESHPVVYGEYLKAGPQAPTVLVYGHYDVQPAEPLDKWESEPFEPQVRGENLFARGATDMKGQVAATLFALEAIAQNGNLPVNLKFMIEGEEEIGSPHLGDFIAGHKDLLACDFCLNPDTGMLAPDVPTITYALRGLAYFEVRVYGPKHDVHSGVFGGVVHNPAQALCELIAGMHDDEGHITLPDFYERVRPLEAGERAELARLPVTEALLKQRTGVPALWGEPEFTPVERLGARPTLEVNGLYSGFIGEGSKTVLPAYAMAKISMRLVPDQVPAEVAGQLRKYLEMHAPPTIRWEVREMVHGDASISDIHSPWVEALSKAMEAVWGKRPVFKREGGSVPVVGQLQSLLGVDSVNTGFALPDDNMHGPNEKLHLPTWNKGIQTFIHFFYNLGEPR